MRPVCFLIFFLHLVISSLAKLGENEVLAAAKNQSSIRLDIYDARGLCGTCFAPNSSSYLSNILLRDQERVKALSDRIDKKDQRRTTSMSPHKSGHLLDPNSDSTIPLNSGLSINSGNYFVKVGLGTPSKFYSMIIDTGSSLSWLQCQPCVVYCHSQSDPLFSPSASKTYQTLSCSSSECSAVKESTLNDPLCDTPPDVCIYTASYGDSSFSVGYLSKDQLTLTPSQTLPRFVFGCGQDNQGLFGKSSGIVGLARDKLSMTGQLSSKYGYAFSYCLPTSTSPGGGSLSLGKIVPSSYKFTPMLSDSKNPSLYFLRLAAITVAGKPIAVSASQYQVPTIIDSGTVITRLPQSIYKPLRDAFVKIVSQKYQRAGSYSILDACFKGSPKSITSVPQIQMVFQGGAELALPAPNVLIEADNGITCLAFASSDSIAIIGNHQQQTFNVAYDVSSSKIGFAPGGCH